MNEKNAKLLRYFVKHSGDIQLAAVLKTEWPNMTAKARGKISRWMKKVVVTLMAVKDAREKHEAKRKAMIQARNMEVLKGFTS